MMITFEGGEGSGKSTLMRELAKECEARGHAVLLTREPGQTEIGEAVRTLLLKQSSPICPKSELCLFLASRAQQITDVIQPALKEEKWVFCDRFNDSTIAYQGGGRELGIDYVKEVCDTLCSEVSPKLTFYLNVDPDVALQRKNPHTFDRIEKEALAFHRRVQEAYLELAMREPERIHILDADQPLTEVIASAKAILEPCFV